MKNKHLSFDDRLEIEKGLKENKSFKAIGTIINKDCTTISKEIKNHIVFKYVGTVGRKHFDCKQGKNCPFRQKGTLCNFNNCEHYEKLVCPKLSKPPYVCNGCKEKNTCSLSKRFYESTYAFKEYKDNLYMRIDLVKTNEEYQVMEVELLDPQLFLNSIISIYQKKEAYQTFTKEIINRITK